MQTVTLRSDCRTGPNPGFRGIGAPAIRVPEGVAQVVEAHLWKASRDCVRLEALEEPRALERAAESRVAEDEVVGRA
jgi:hypothetical protein